MTGLGVFGVCLWKGCSPTWSLGGGVWSRGRSWKDLPLGRSPGAKTGGSCGLSGKGGRIGAVESGGDFSKA